MNAATGSSTADRDDRTVPELTGRVVLGSAGERPPANSTTAERWGAAYAARSNKPAVLLGAISVHVSPPYADVVYVPTLLDDARQALDVQLERMRQDLLADHPSLDLTCASVPGPAGSVLVDASQDAALVVIGTRGLDGWSGLLLGSISHHVVTHARGPVAVVPAELTDDLTDEDPIVLGVDGESDRAAAAFAFAEARAQGRPLIAVHSWRPGDRWSENAHGSSEPPQVQLDHVLEETLTPWTQEYPDVEVLRQVVRGDSELALLGASARAAMLVLGTRGRGEIRSVLFGSTSLRMLGRASCPAVVVPEPRH